MSAKRRVCRAALDAIGESSRRILGDDRDEAEVVAAATSTEVEAAYVARLHLVAQMLTLERDPDPIPVLPLGRIASNDAPPRLGHKLGKSVRADGAL